MNASEQTTLNFYNWEYRFRGYYHFDTPVDIETPYIPFRHATCSKTPIVDDGRVPSLFKQVTKLLSPQKETEESTQEMIEVQPRYLALENIPNLTGISLSFPKGTEILPNRNIEFLNTLSFTEHLLSFEIIGTVDDISIRVACSEHDKDRVQSQLLAYFPAVICRDVAVDGLGFSVENDIAIADFGLNDEYMRSIATTESFSIDPLTSVIATMESLQENDVIVLQVLFKGITSPLAKDISYSVSDGRGGSFFVDAPEMPQRAKEKIAHPLFSVVMRIATQGKDNYRSQYLAQELARSISAVSTSQHNKLIPLSNEGYDYDFHKYNLHHRLSNRLGFVLNSKELNTFVHYPNKTVTSKKLGSHEGKTKAAPKEVTDQKYLLGVNQHNGLKHHVMLNDDMRLRHTHIIGTTGVGKSTLIASMLLEDMRLGNGCTLLDPHGDIVEDILLRIPEHRKDDVIVIDPSDTDYIIGFNLLNATTDAEKIVLSSDLVSSFKRHATSWGDNMSAVLSNAINTFLESSRQGTLIELKRFLLEERFRKEFLSTVDDSAIHYYWNNEYSLVRKGIAPLLTRIDTFLRPKVIRYMLAQSKGVDFRCCIEQKKIVLIKLSQGLIGEENSFLLGSMFLSKFNQVAQGRQSLPKSQRPPYYIYCDEFQNFITPSISQILSGARKYGLALILAHQELAQIDDPKILNSVISNPYTRICFRLGDSDAKRLETGFSYFEQSDLQSLAIGQTIMRTGSSQDDFNLSTFPLCEVNSDSDTIREYVINNTQNIYAQPKEKLDEILFELLPKQALFKKEKKEKTRSTTDPIKKQGINRSEEKTATEDTIQTDDHLKAHTSKYIEQVKEQEVIRKHRSVQYYVQSIARQHGFKATLEEPTKKDGKVDVALVRDNIRIAIEVSVTNSMEYELKNIQKCIDDGYSLVFMISEDKRHLENIKEQASTVFKKKYHSQIHFLAPEEFPTYLDALKQPKSEEKRVRGYRVKVNYKNDANTGKLSLITNIMVKALRKK
ncbi:type IV secretory system conjugative DNA transfer family protein [Bizionia sp.]|uniref:type IV secretory system conjugative DNA transfer family protein n=1 Tax=Bizionia sp. TaxID=1954480 RepID=UPI003A901F02